MPGVERKVIDERRSHKRGFIETATDGKRGSAVKEKIKRSIPVQKR